MIKVYLDNDVWVKLLSPQGVANTRFLGKIEQIRRYALFVYGPEQIGGELDKTQQLSVHKVCKGYFLPYRIIGTLGPVNSLQQASEARKDAGLPSVHLPYKAVELLGKLLKAQQPPTSLEGLLKQWEEAMQADSVVPQGTHIQFKPGVLAQAGGSAQMLLKQLTRTKGTASLKNLLSDLDCCLRNGTAKAISPFNTVLTHAGFAADMYVIRDEERREKLLLRLKSEGLRLPRFFSPDEFLRFVDSYVSLPTSLPELVDQLLRLSNHPLAQEATDTEGNPAVVLPIDQPFLHMFEEAFVTETNSGRNMRFTRDLTKRPVFQVEVEKLQILLNTLFGESPTLELWQKGPMQVNLLHTAELLQLIFTFRE